MPAPQQQHNRRMGQAHRLEDPIRPACCAHPKPNTTKLPWCSDALPALSATPGHHVRQRDPGLQADADEQITAAAVSFTATRVLFCMGRLAEARAIVHQLQQKNLLPRPSYEAGRSRPI